MPRNLLKLHDIPTLVMTATSTVYDWMFY